MPLLGRLQMKWHFCGGFHTLCGRNLVSLQQYGHEPVKEDSHKYGIEVLQTVEDAFRIDNDKENDNTLWEDALKLEIGEIGVAIDILEDSEELLPGYRKSSGHIIFDVKMDFKRKARDGFRTDIKNAAA